MMIDVLMADRCTRAEAEKFLKNGTVIKRKAKNV